MESYGLDMEDIFDTEANLDDDLAAPRSMPDLEDDDTPINRNFGEGEENGDEDAPDADVLSKLKDISKGAAKKKVMRPQPKLDLERLQSKRGLRALPAAFEAVKFKGKGHEAADLGLLMGKLEHWAHRLYPKLPFDDFVERLEKLGAKKQVQTCIKRIRLDMEDLGADDVVRGEGEEENTDKPEEGAAAAAAAPEFTDLDAEEAYEEMMREERERAEKRKSKEGDFSSPRTPHKSNTDVVETDSPARSQSQKQNPTKSPGSSQPAKSGGMTEEQMARMERNRQLAIERRLAKFGQSPAPGSKVQSASQKVPESPDKPSDKPQPKPDEKPLPSKSKTNVEEAGDQGTAEELEAMLNDDIGEELTDNKCTDDSMNLHLTESLSTQSEQPMTQQNAQGSRSEVEADSEERAPQKSVTESEGKEESDKLDLPMTVTESEGVGIDKKAENSELELRLTATVSEEKDSMEEEESDALKLRLTATETEATERSESSSETQKLQLRLSESEVAAENSDSLNLKLSETQDTESTSVPTRKESDSDNMNLRLDMSVSEEESGDV